HLFTLAHAARRPSRAPVDRGPEVVPDRTRRLLRVMHTPAVVLGRHLDLIAWNAAAEALLGAPGDLPPDRLNMLLLLFDDELTGGRTCPD
ncbi:XRE family transcriptional regulator, partial [Streptomyces sp. IpFD-1.1]|nr:XRE family transcriptional regulator [Streptomyces sp. IpFD-1.1]